MKTISTIFLVLFSTLCVAQPGIYKQVDSQGNVSYSNIHSEDAKKVELPSITVVPAIDTSAVNSKMQRRMESIRNKAESDAIEKEIAEETNYLEQLKNEYNDDSLDILDIERNQQGYFNNRRSERLKSEVLRSEENLDALRYRLEASP